MHFAYKYGGDFEGALLANANAGGECVARGMLIGALLGAAHGASRIPEHLKHGLVARAAITRQIKRFVGSVQSTPSRKPSSAPKKMALEAKDRETSDKKNSTGPSNVASEAVAEADAGHAEASVLPQLKQPLPVLPSETDGEPPQPPPAGVVSLML